MRRSAFIPAGLAALLLLFACGFAIAGEFDPFDLAGKVPDLPARAAMEGEDTCRFNALSIPLGLPEAVERAICHNPQSRQAWADAKAQAAVVGTHLATYLPTVEASFSAAKQKNDTTISTLPMLDSSVSPTVRTDALKMSLILTDFGRRGAQLDQARALLDAANATHDAVLQSALLNAAQVYFHTLTAQAALDAAREAERAAKESFLAAEAKYQAGIAGLTDQLQASTAYAQARLDLVAAEGELKNAQGSLASAMGLAVGTPLVLAQYEKKLPDTAFVKPINDLIEDARRDHPRLQAVRAELAAAQAHADSVQAEGRPKVSLVSEIERQKQADQLPSLGYPPGDVSYRNRSLGVQVIIPLFEGFGRGYRTSAARSQAESKAAELEKIEREVTLGVWKSYQLLETEVASLRATDELVDNAQKSFDVARGRYKAGMGGMIELLNAQSAFVNAERQRIKSLSNWHAARLKLAASVGKIGLWAIR